ncbi:MAG: 3'-5' exonuclease [Spirochaetaceae bacterium]|jgi:DNA polymerase-3 subunit epsilon|nr:3'-5' exonuclease [Spirochaetaceae bacterium]
MNFVTIDFETAKYSPESACSIGMIKFKNGKAVDSFYSLIQPPELFIRPDFTAIHGLTVENVKNAPLFSQIWKKTLSFIDKLPLAAHNAQFDMRVLKAVLAWYDLFIPPLHYFCTLDLSRAVWPELPSHTLSRLAAHFGIIYAAHNAQADAETCGKIALLAAQQTGCVTLKSLLDATQQRLKKLCV